MDAKNKNYFRHQLKDYLHHDKHDENHYQKMLQAIMETNLSTSFDCLITEYVKSTIERRIPLIFLVDYVYRNYEAAKTYYVTEAFLIHMMEDTFANSHLPQKLKLWEMMNEWEQKEIYSSGLRFRIRKTFQNSKNERIRPDDINLPVMNKMKMMAKKRKNEAYNEAEINCVKRMNCIKSDTKKNKLLLKVFNTICRSKDTDQCKVCGIAFEPLKEKQQCKNHSSVILSDLTLNTSVLIADDDGKLSRGHIFTTDEWLAQAKALYGFEKKDEKKNGKSEELIKKEQKMGKKKINKVFATTRYPAYCDICGDGFEKEFDQEAETWVYKDARSSEKNEKVLVHDYCNDAENEEIVVDLE